MCRMGFVSSNAIMDHTLTIKNASKFYSDENPDGFGFAYLKEGRIIFYNKVGESAKEFWLKNPTTRIVSNLALFHDRRASVGSISSINSHPFVYQQIALAHNGTLSNYQDLKQDLIRRGFNFVSQTDSEVLLGVWLYHGIKLPSVLQKWGVQGKVTIIVLTPDGIFLYTNNNAMVVYKFKDQLIGFSDDRILGPTNSMHIRNNVVYHIMGTKMRTY